MAPATAAPTPGITFKAPVTALKPALIISLLAILFFNSISALEVASKKPNAARSEKSLNEFFIASEA